MTPRVSVLLPVRNGARHLRAALRSILAQSLRELEVLLLDDGSTDGSADIAAAEGDPRVRVLSSPPMGLARQLNRGIREARAPYVARMDADDIAEPERLACQVSFLAAHPSVAICGTWLRCFSPASTHLARYPVGRETVRAYVVFDNPVAHPSACWRAASWQAAGLAYDETLEVAQDYDVWSRALDQPQVDNVPAPLLRYRVHTASVTGRRAELSEQAARRIQAHWLSRLGLAMDEPDLAFHRLVGHGAGMRDAEELARAEAWLLRVLAANRAARVFADDGLARAAGFVWLRVCLNSARAGAFAARAYGASPLARNHSPAVSEWAQLWAAAAAARWRGSPAVRPGLREDAA